MEELRLLPGLTEQELKDLEASLPCPLREEARAVLAYSRGFQGVLESVDLFIDLRHAKTGDGFSWGRYGPRTINRRFGEKRIVTCQMRKPFWQRLWRR